MEKLILFISLVFCLSACNVKVYQPLTGELSTIKKKELKAYKATYPQPDYVVETSPDWINEGAFIVRAHRNGDKEIICVPIHSEDCHLKAAIIQTQQCGSSIYRETFFDTAIPLRTYQSNEFKSIRKGIKVNVDSSIIQTFDLKLIEEGVPIN